MPGRIARSSVSIAKPKNARNKSRKRNLEAFSIASHDQPERFKLKRHRLGEVEDDEVGRKRQRTKNEDEDDEDEDGDLEEERSVHMNASRKGQDDMDLSEGSDSEGNTWKVGHVDEDDDSDIDSDEAFGESDEERFEGFTFRGSAGGKIQQRGKKLRKDRGEAAPELDLDEDTGEDQDEEGEDSFGEEGIDLATALDQYEPSDEDQPPEEGDTGGIFASEDEDEVEEESDDNEAAGAARLRDLVSSLPTNEPSSSSRDRTALNDSAPIDDYAIGSGKLDLDMLTEGDPEARKQLRQITKASKSSKRGVPSGVVAVPLPKRQQDRIDRRAANQKAKETLERWVDTVKQNRRAEHLSFPLVDPEAAEPLGAKRMLPTSQSKPMTDLESTIQGILQESGLATAHGGQDEERIRRFEELEAKKIPLEEIEARRAELRRSRELMFREEARAKRVKKIKSKSYRRVHRKERERISLRDREKNGFNSEEEREHNDRRRAEERMGAKHRESKWAKGVKESGRAAWDDDARSGVTEMARRNEELRHRIQGRDVRREDSDPDSDVSLSEEEEEDAELSDEEAEARSIKRRLDKLQTNASAEDNTKLGNMAFMQRAEAARKAQNDEDIERMRRELAGEEFSDEQKGGDDALVGRRSFGPTPKNVPQIQPKTQRGEFEEGFESEQEWNGIDDDEDEAKIVVNGSGPVKPSSKSTLQSHTARIKGAASSANATASEDNPFLTGPPKGRNKRTQESAALIQPTLSLDPAPSKTQPAAQQKLAEDNDGWTVVSYKNGAQDPLDESDASDEEETFQPMLTRQQELIRKGFAGDEAAADFTKEKEATTREDDDQTVSTALPGWGSWTGAGLTKRERAQGKRDQVRGMKKVEGVKPHERKDAKLKNVIISEKRVKKNVPYLAGQLPHPFETRAEYERSLRMPVGKEWNTKVQVQENVKPRVMVKRGRVIEAMSKPMV